MHTGCRTITRLDELLKTQLQRLLFVRVILLTILLAISGGLQNKGLLAQPKALPILFAFIAGVYAFTILSALLIKHLPCYRKLTYLQLCIDTLLISALVLVTGGSGSIFLLLYFYPMVAGGFMLFRPGGLALASWGTILFGVVLFLEYQGYRINIFRIAGSDSSTAEELLNLFAVNGLCFFLVAILSSLLAERLYRVEAKLIQTAANYDRLALLYKQIFDDITTGIITVDSSQRISSFNRAAETITGFEAGEVLGREINRFFPALSPVDGRTNRLTVQLRRKNGETIPVGYSWSRLHAADQGENSLVFTMQDLSQIQRMEQQLRQSEKMAAIGEMAASIAHEFRNPLAAISGSAQILAQKLPQQETVSSLLAIINRECERLERVVQEFLLFSRPSTPSPEPVDLCALAWETVELLKKTPHWKESHRFHCKVARGCTVWVDRDQFRQVLLNLFANSIQAMEEGGEFWIEAAPPDLTTSPAMVAIRIGDTGCGISQEILSRIFDPYFTTKKKGTGLGLAIVHQIVAGHAGSIVAENNVPRGTIFTLLLPVDRSLTGRRRPRSTRHRPLSTPGRPF